MMITLNAFIFFLLYIHKAEVEDISRLKTYIVYLDKTEVSSNNSAINQSEVSSNNSAPENRKIGIEESMVDVLINLDQEKMGVTVQTSEINHSEVSSNNSAPENRKNGIGESIADVAINLDHGDPTMFEAYWEKMSERSAVTLPGSQSLSYFSDPKNLCWFLEPKLEQEIKRLHTIVGNVAIEEGNYYIVVGTGSSQLIQAALYALSPPDATATVVCAAPYYSAYPEVADLVRSRRFEWGGDARSFERDDEPFIELVTTPNNPDGVIREAVVNRPHGSVVYDLAYYWPHFTPITAPANHDLMLFTFSKCTGHAGSRIGWALVKDKEVAKKMIKFMEVSTIGVSKDSQLRAAKILGTVSDSCSTAADIENFFVFSRNILKERWNRLREVVKAADLFTLLKYPTQYCRFAKDITDTVPAFAWIATKGEEDCAEVLKKHKILGRGGTKFGVGKQFARISLVSKDEEFNLLLQRLSIIQGTDDLNYE